MANRTWTNGGGDGLFTTAGNWSGAAVPTTGDNIIVPKTTSAITCTGMTAVVFGTLDITPECYLAIGSTGTPLSGSFTDIRQRGRSGAKLYFTDTAVGVTNRILIAGEAGADLAELTGALPLLCVERGRCTVLSSATGLTQVIVGDVNNPTSDAYLSIASTDTVTDLDVCSGLCLCESIITRANVSGGTLIRRAAAACATLRASQNARVYYEGTGTITDLFAMGDSIIDLDRKYSDASGTSDERSAALTVTRSMRLHGATLNANSVYITKTAATVDWGLLGV